MNKFVSDNSSSLSTSWKTSGTFQSDLYALDSIITYPLGVFANDPGDQGLIPGSHTPKTKKKKKNAS